MRVDDVVRLPSFEGGFADVPLMKETSFMAGKHKCILSLSAPEEDTPHLVMQCDHLQQRGSSSVYSCGGLLVLFASSKAQVTLYLYAPS